MATSDSNFSIELDEKKGRVLVAKRPLNQGELILHEKPLVHGMSRDSGLVCLGCYGSLDDEDPYACRLCGLPLCSAECEQSSAHEPECQAFQSLGQERGRQVTMELLEDIPTLLDIIMILRCLGLKSKTNDEWFKLNQLQSDFEDHLDSDLEEAMNHTLHTMLLHFQQDRDTLLRLYGILTINAFEIPNATSEANLASIYATGCLPEHHCVPTCHRSFGPDLSITLRAAVALETNQRISITYTDSLWPTLDRRAHLAYSKHFLCDCSRYTVVGKFLRKSLIFY